MRSRSEKPAQTSRREWARLVAAGVVATPSIAQVTQKTPPQGAPKPAPPGNTPQQRLDKAYADIRTVSDQLSKLEVPMDVEPAFSFRAS